jgi:hypothetical protein
MRFGIVVEMCMPKSQGVVAIIGLMKGQDAVADALSAPMGMAERC